jgi:hypothetical protein
VKIRVAAKFEPTGELKRTQEKLRFCDNTMNDRIEANKTKKTNKSKFGKSHCKRPKLFSAKEKRRRLPPLSILKITVGSISKIAVRLLRENQRPAILNSRLNLLGGFGF